MTSILKRADDRLHEWGRWGAGSEWLGLPSITLLGRWMEQGEGASQHGRQPISCPEHIAEVDSAVCKLSLPLKDVCKAQYLMRGDLPSKAKRLRISRASYKNRLEMAMRRIASTLGL